MIADHCSGSIVVLPCAPTAAPLSAEKEKLEISEEERGHACPIVEGNKRRSFLSSDWATEYGIRLF
jgi:hypothetical protein